MAEQDFDASRWLKQYQAEWEGLTPAEQKRRLTSALTYSGLLALGPMGSTAAQAYFAYEHGPQLREVERALRRSVPRTMAFLHKQLSEFDPTELAALWPMLADTAMEAGAYIGGGGIVGALLFGAPTAGAAAPVGAALGMKAGAWVYKAAGIAEMAIDMPDMFDAVTKPYRKGFAAAWARGEMGAAGGADRQLMLETVAIESFAEGHTLLVVALLSALAVLLLQKGARNTPLFEALRRGKLGAHFSDWAKKNQLTLMESRRLKPQKSLGQRVQDELDGKGLTQERKPEPKDKPEPKPTKTRPCDHLRGGNPDGKGPYRGGAHSHTSKPYRDGKDSHHMPADDASPLPKSDGPAIQMDPGDHHKTQSNGRWGPDSVLYRDEIKKLLKSNEWGKAMAKEIRDVRNVAMHTGDRRKYDEALREMLTYYKCVDKHKAAYLGVK